MHPNKNLAQAENHMLQNSERSDNLEIVQNERFKVIDFKTASNSIIKLRSFLINSKYKHKLE